MLRARRIASIAVVALLGATALAGCRSDPSVAAYVGDSVITREHVDEIYEDARVKLTEARDAFLAEQPQDPAASPGASPRAVEMPITRQDVVTTLLGRDVLRELARDRDVSVTQPPEEQLAQVEQAIQLPRNTRYAQVYLEFQSYVQALIEGVELEPQPLTEADLRDVFKRVRRAGGMEGLGDTFAEFSQGLDEQSRQTLTRAFALRDLFYAQVEKLDAKVNPRYAPAEVPLVSGRSATGDPVALVVLRFSVQGAEAPVVEAA